MEINDNDDDNTDIYYYDTNSHIDDDYGDNKILTKLVIRMKRKRL